MYQPDALKTQGPLLWSPGRGTEVWAMFCACVAGDCATVRQLLTRDPALARCQHAYRTPLYFAVRENRVDVAGLLLDQGADPLSLAVNETLVQMTRDRGHREMERLLTEWLAERCNASPRGEPVARAIRERDPAKVAALLEVEPAWLRVGDERSNQLIHWAVMTRQPGLVDALLARGADLEARRYDGARPIHLAHGDYFYRGCRDVPNDVTTTPEEMFRHLVDRGAQVDLVMAAAIGDVNRVCALLAEDPASVNRVSEYGSYYLGCGSALKNAAARGHLEIVRLLLERGADPNLPEEGIAPRGHALYAAAANGQLETARLLLEHGADPNAPVESSADALSRAIMREDRPMVDLLCSYGAARPVEYLAYYNDLPTAAAVFAANPELANDPEALAAASSEGHEAFVRLMLRYRPALPRRVTFPGWAVGGQTRALNELLFQHGMNASTPDWLGVTPLHEFARKGDLEKAAIFLEHGADLSARDEDICSTPLGWAAKFGQTAMVEYLLRSGAKPRLPDDPPWATPLAWATRRGHHEIAGLLEQQLRRETP